MRAEIRSDGLHISGYVNVPGRKSRPIFTARGKVIEEIEQGAFAAAIERASEIRMLQDHRPDRVLADTSNGTLTVKEDAVGLRAESVITDDVVINAAKAGKLRGWSFNMKRIQDEMEDRAEGELPIRHVKSFDMDEISLIIDRIPCYSSTSVEVRGEDEESVEIRANDFLLEDTDGQHIICDEWKKDIAAKRAVIETLKGGVKDNE